jgi:lysophospholipase L1-like esterase
MTNLQKSALVALGFAFLAACSSSNGTTPSAPASSKPLDIAYTAIGASDAVGYGASVPCTEASPALVADPTCPEPGADGYVPDIRTDFAGVGFAAALQDLGISGAVIGPDIQTLGNKYSSVAGPTPCQQRTPGVDAIPANFLQNELPSVNPAATFVTIFAGGNDVNAIVNAIACGAAADPATGMTTQASVTAFITAEVTAFGGDFATLVGAVHVKAPSATIVVANIPNFANVPYALGFPASLRAALQGTSVAIDTDVINTVAAKGVPVVDTQCNPASYDPANFYTDGFHPNDTGYAILAQKFVQQALAEYPLAPESTCSYQAISSVAKEPQARALARGTKPAFPAR